jgi:hypothetical protein
MPPSGSMIILVGVCDGMGRNNVEQTNPALCFQRKFELSALHWWDFETDSYAILRRIGQWPTYEDDNARPNRGHIVNDFV